MIWQLRENQPCTVVSAAPCSPSLNNLYQFLGNLRHGAAVIVWYMQGIVSGRWQDKELLLLDSAVEPEKLLEMRAFNEQEELFIQKQGTQWMCRYILDGEGETNTDYIDTEAPLWGQVRETDGQSVTMVDEGRKLKLRLPYEGAAEPGDYCFLRTRNYILRLSDGQAGFGDYRYISVGKEGGMG